MRTLALLMTTGLVACFAAGCSKVDPCNGVSDGCIIATVKGSIEKLDSLQIGIDKPSPVTLTSTTGNGREVALPVELAIVPPSSLAGTSVQLTIGASLSGKVLASLTQPVSVPGPGQRISVTFDLTSTSGDGGPSGTDGSPGTSDGGNGGDGSVTNGVLVASTTSLTFPDTARGSTSASMTITISNPGTEAISFKGMPTALGDSTSFNVGNSGTCPMGSLPVFNPGFSCDLGVTFAPVVSGKLVSTITLETTTGSTTTLTFTGTGIPAWSDETPSNGPMAFTAVSGSGPNDVYAVSSEAGKSVYHYNGTGWMQVDGTGITDTGLNAVLALDVNNVWVAASSGANGIAFENGIVGPWTAQTNDDALMGGQIYAMVGLTANQLYAIESAPSMSAELLFFKAGNWEAAGPPLAGTNTARALAVAKQVLMVGGTNGQVAFGPITGSGPAFSGSFVPTGVPSASTIVSAWGDSQANKFYFIANNGPGGGGAIFSMTSGLQGATQEFSTAMTLSAIYGRSTALSGTTDIWAVGYLGNAILHSTGNGTWT